MTKIFYHEPEEEEIMLQKLKDEIIRVGLEKNASRVKLTALYDRNNMPHPITYVKNYGTWESILKRIGLENKGRIAAVKPEKSSRFYWEDLPEEVWLEKLIVELCRVNLNRNPSVAKLRAVYDNKNIPSPTTYKIKLGSWENVLKKIELDERISRKVTESYRSVRKDSTLIKHPRRIY